MSNKDKFLSLVSIEENKTLENHQKRIELRNTSKAILEAEINKNMQDNKTLIENSFKEKFISVELAEFDFT